MLNFFKNLSPIELLLIALIFLFIFGRKMFINVARTSGETLKEIKSIKNNFDEVVEETSTITKKEV